MRKLLTDTDEHIYSTKMIQLYRAYGFTGIGLLHIIRVRIAQHESGIDSEELKHMLHVKGELVEIWNYLIDEGFIIDEFGEITEETALDNAEIYKKKKNYDREYHRARKEKESCMSTNVPELLYSLRIRNAFVTLS